MVYNVKDSFLLCEASALFQQVTEYVTGDRGIKEIDLSDWWREKWYQIRKVSVPCGDSDALAALCILHNFTPTIQHPVYLWGAFFIPHQSSKSVYFLAFSSHVFCHYHQQIWEQHCSSTRIFPLFYGLSALWILCYSTFPPSGQTSWFCEHSSLHLPFLCSHYWSSIPWWPY